ncbi:MAG: di-heme-cytochrome C peroxidase [Candidatus Electrothrix sp. YB6]
MSLKESRRIGRSGKIIRQRIRLKSLTASIIIVMALTVSGNPAAASNHSSESPDIKFLDQGWNPEIRESFYYTPQGSRLMPYKWFMALEQAGSTKRFSSAENLSRYGWLKPSKGATELNPGELPVGFAVDPVEVEGTGKWMGLTCAACHTNDVMYKGKRLRIDGAPALADFGAFMQDLSTAVNATLLDEKKFRRFAAKVLSPDAKEDDVTNLRGAYLAFTNRITGRAWMRTPPLPAGAGRVDALGQIINALAVFDLEVPDNLRPPSAPVSYPFLWYTPFLSWVQWNPIASNPIARNAGEVLGVFGSAQFTGSRLEQADLAAKIKIHEKLQQLAKDLVPPDLHKQAPPASRKLKQLIDKIQHAEGKDSTGMLSSTVLYTNLNDLEGWLRELKSPRWDDELFGPIDMELGKKGAELFTKNCRGCHNMPPFDMTPKEENIVGKQFIKIGRINYQEVGTDPAYINNLIARFTATGDLASILFEGKGVVPAATFFLGSVSAVVEKGLNDLGLSKKQLLEYSDYRFYPAKPGEEPKPYQPDDVTSFKAGPLLGMWATAPFLHNGSVPNMYELLSPPEERSKVFWVGNPELDLERLGYVSVEQPGLFRFDTSLPGNSNQGHIYPARPYTHEQKMAVIEFLKDPYRFLEEAEL